MISSPVQEDFSSISGESQRIVPGGSPPSYWTMFTGSVQRYQNGNTLIGWTFGNPLVATEVTSNGSTVWEGTLHATGSQVPYRFTKIVSLYGYAQP